MEDNQSPASTKAQTLGKDDIPDVTLEQQEPKQEETPGDTGELPAPEAPKELSDDEFLSAYEKRFGTKPASIDDLKPKGSEPSEDDKRKAEMEEDKLLLELHMKRSDKNTVEGFVDLKKLAAIDPTELTLMELKAEYKAAGFSDEEVDQKIKQDYYAYSDEEIEEFEEEDREKFKNRREFFKPKLRTGSEFKKQAAANYFDSLRQEIKNAENEKKEQAEQASKVEAFAKTFDRKVKVPLGMHNDMQLEPVDFEFSPEAVKIATDILKDQTALEQLIYKPDGSLNIERLMPLLALEHDKNDFAKKSHIVGADREVKKFGKIFPENGRKVAVASAATTLHAPGKVVSAKTSSKYD